MTGTTIANLVRVLVHDASAPYRVDDAWMVAAINDGLEWLRHNAPECLLRDDGRRSPFLRIGELGATLCVRDPYQVPLVQHVAAAFHLREGGDEAQRDLAKIHQNRLAAWLTGE